MRISSVALGPVVLLLLACGSSSEPNTPPGEPVREFMMGFSAIPPRMDTTLLLPTLNLAVQHSDAGLIQLSIPWAILLADTAAATEVRLVRLPLVNFYRASGMRIVVALDVTNGLDRSQEDPVLVGLGRSITDTAIQRHYREYVQAVDSILHPDYMSLAAETNLIRAAAPAPVYNAVVTMVNAAAAELRARNTLTLLMVSVQVETAWGRFQGTNTFIGIAQDRTDFPFLDALGLSSYPYLGGFTQPEAIPDDYFGRLVQSAPLPVLILEGGWPSVSVAGIASSPALQARYIRRQGELLSAMNAKGLFQITFTDLHPTIIPPGSSLTLFATLGLVDTALQAKPALATWDSILR